jgi:hypothetical protein
MRARPFASNRGVSRGLDGGLASLTRSLSDGPCSFAGTSLTGGDSETTMFARGVGYWMLRGGIMGRLLKSFPFIGRLATAEVPSTHPNRSVSVSSVPERERAGRGSNRGHHLSSTKSVDRVEMKGVLGGLKLVFGFDVLLVCTLSSSLFFGSWLVLHFPTGGFLSTTLLRPATKPFM